MRGMSGDFLHYFLISLFQLLFALRIPVAPTRRHLFQPLQRVGITAHRQNQHRRHRGSCKQMLRRGLRWNGLGAGWREMEANEPFAGGAVAADFG